MGRPVASRSEALEGPIELQEQCDELRVEALSVALNVHAVAARAKATAAPLETG